MPFSRFCIYPELIYLHPLHRELAAATRAGGTGHARGGSVPVLENVLREGLSPGFKSSE